MNEPNVAIVDFGMGNLFSVKRACEESGMNATITHSRDEILAADAVFLPGVGAYGDAMASLQRLDLIPVLRDIAHSETPLVGICLGMQLLMTESEEFGVTRGLDLIPGRVVRLGAPQQSGRTLKVPQVGWNEIRTVGSGWSETVLSGIPDRSYLYFVHSLVVVPDAPDVVISTTRYGDVEFCSSLQKKNLFACQYHPERSGTIGIKIYDKIKNWIGSRVTSTRR